jgi:hypothetical protein
VYFFQNRTILDTPYSKLGPEAFEYMNKAMDYIILAAFSMWIGYKIKLGNNFYYFLTHNKIFKSNFFRKTFLIRKNVVLFLFISSIVARLISIQLGLFGYSQSPENREEYGAVMNILYLIGSLGSFTLLAYSIFYFTYNNGKILFIIVFIIELIFGILSGMKSQIMMPFFITLFSYYLVRHKINRQIFAYAILSIFLAYYIVEPFRILRYVDKNFQSNPSYIIRTLTDSYEMNKRLKLVENQRIDQTFLQFLGRLEYTLTTARAIQYKDQVGLSTSDPDFEERLLTILPQAFIPRAFWEGKTIENNTQWYSYRVWGSTATNSVAYSPIGFLYFAGGSIGTVFYIVLFFGLFGTMQKILFKFLNRGGGGIIVYAGLLMSVVIIDSTVNTIFVDWIRMLPALFILQYMTLKR